MTEQELVKQCVFEIFRKNGYGSTDNLTQRDYDHISREIQAETSILISVSTLKRLINGSFSRLPQIATLDAISGYLGYANWQEYRASAKSRPTAPEVRADLEKDREPAAVRRPVWRATGLAPAASLLVLLFIAFSSRPEDHHYERATFSARKTTDNDLPNTVVFSYNVDGVKADSFFIQQSWDVGRRVRVYPGHYTLTDIYYEPGYHVAKLMANDSVIRTVDVSIPTDRWFFYSRLSEPGDIAQYIEPDALPVENGVLALTEQHLAAAGVDTDQERSYCYTYFPSKLEVSSDNFCFRARVRLREVRNNLCPRLMVEVFGRRNFLFFNSTPRGCASEAMIQYGEHFISGKEADLSALTYDLSEWMEVEVVVMDKKVTILFGGEPVYTMTYQTSSGLITGLGFISNGLCEVDDVELRGLDGRVVYASDFEVDI